MENFETLRKIDNMFFRKAKDPRYYKVLDITNKIEIRNGTAEALVKIATSDDLSKCEVVTTDSSNDEFYTITDNGNPVKLDRKRYCFEMRLDYILGRCLGYGVKFNGDIDSGYYLYYFDGKGAATFNIDEFGIIIFNTNDNLFKFQEETGIDKFYNSEEDVYKWNSYTKVVDGKEIKVDGDYKYLLLNDEQKKLVEELRGLNDRMKSAGIKIFYDYTRGECHIVNNTMLYTEPRYDDDVDEGKSSVGYHDFLKLPAIYLCDCMDEERVLQYEKKD